MAAVYFYVWVAIVFGNLTLHRAVTANNLCPSACPQSCLGDYVDCSRLGLIEVPNDLPSWVKNLELQSNGISELNEDDFKGLIYLEELDLSNNEISFIDERVFMQLLALKVLKINSNKLSEIPILRGNPFLTELQLTHNAIHTINATALAGLKNLDLLDLSHNVIMDIRNESFPANLTLHKLFLSSNKIFSFEAGSLNNLTELETLKLNKNKISILPRNLFQNLTKLKSLDLAKNQLRGFEVLPFRGLKSLQVLKLRRNSISQLSAGVFFGLSRIQSLQLDQNNLTAISKEWLYGLENLKQLSVSFNKIVTIEADGWEYCPNLQILDLANNEVTTIQMEQFSRLTNLKMVKMAHNHVEVIETDGFKDLSSLEELDLNDNRISWTIEDVKGAFMGLSKLRKLDLEHNRIKTITRQAFTGLDSLEELSLINNNITSIHGNAFDMMPGLRQLEFNTSSLLCDCQLSWLPMWLRNNNFERAVIAKCSHPENVKGRSIFVVDSSDFKCDGHFPKPHIIMNPKEHKLLKGENVTLTCTATSTENQGSPTQFQWKKENVLMVDAFMESYANHSDNLTHYTSRLHIRNAQDVDTGSYQCIISNEFGSAYSKKARIDVFVFPVFTKIPENVTAKEGTNIRLVCAADGQPKPEISWQKDGGDHFPAAQERRMHVIPEDDHFYITDLKPEDEGLYSCIATSDAGTITANVTVTVLQKPTFVKPMESKVSHVGETTVLECLSGGSPQPKLSWLKDGEPLDVTQRHFFTSENQLLVIVDTSTRDAGEYTCEMTNTLGTERGISKLTVIKGGQDNSEGSQGNGGDGGLDDESTTTGIIIIAVVCCVVGTSLVWVIIIYQTRKRQELYSATPTDETTLPGEVPSSGYTSSDKEGSYSHAVAVSMPGYQYQMDMQMKESGYESSSGRFRAARTAAIFPSDVDGEALPNYALLAGETQYAEQSDENSESSLQYPRSETDSVKSDNTGDSSHSSRQNTLTTFHPTPTNHDRTGPSLRAQSNDSLLYENSSPGVRADKNSGVQLGEKVGKDCVPCETDTLNSCDSCANCQHDDENRHPCQKCRHNNSSGSSAPKIPPKPSRSRHGRHKDHHHFDSSQPPGGTTAEDTPSLPSACEGHSTGHPPPPPPPLVQYPGLYPGGYHRQPHSDYPEGVYVPAGPTSNSSYMYHHSPPVNTPPCDCHLMYAPNPSMQHVQPDQRLNKDNTNPRGQRLNGVMRCVHHHVNPAWHGHAYTLPYIHPSAMHQLQTVPPPMQNILPQPSPRGDSANESQQTEQSTDT